jgi:hypothetical protein
MAADAPSQLVRFIGRPLPTLKRNRQFTPRKWREYAKNVTGAEFAGAWRKGHSKRAAPGAALSRLETGAGQ